MRSATALRSAWVLPAAAISLLILTIVGVFTRLATNDPAFVAIVLASAVVYAVAVWRVVAAPPEERPCRRNPLLLILAVAVGLRAIALCAPTLSTDIFRYVWDGRVQGAGINPYAHLPVDPALEEFRDKAIYPNINRKEYARTIYPPVAQMVFFLGTRIVDSVPAMKVTMLVFDAVTVATCLRLLARRGLPASRILLYAWHPLPVWEFAGSGHIDAVAIATMLLAFLAADARRPALAGVALAASTLTKYFPIVTAPALYRPGGRRLPLAFAATLVALYLPYLSAGRHVLGFLGGYVDEEGLGSGKGIYLWSLLRALVPLPGAALALYLGLAIALLATVAALALRRDEGASLGGGLALTLTFTVLFSPHFAWYFAWLIPFLCFQPSIAVVYLTGVSTVLYILPSPIDPAWVSILYAPFAAFLVVDGRRWRRARAQGVA